MGPRDAVNEVRGVRRFAVWLLALLLRAWSRTIRLEIAPDALARLKETPGPVAYVLWHNRLFLAAEIVRRFRVDREIHVLVSASRDGAWLSAFFRMVGLVPVRGSTSRLGREAGRTLIEVLRAGHAIGITPDGPRGPVYEVEPGVLVVTRRTHASLVLLGVEFAGAWRLDSWDRFYLPRPFSRVRVQTTVLPPMKADGTKLVAAEVRAALRAINSDGVART